MSGIAHLEDDPEAGAVIDDLFASCADPASLSSGEIRDFLRSRGLDVPLVGTYSLVAAPDTEGRPVSRPVPDCPGGSCVPKPCPQGFGQCGWVCHCPPE